MTAEAEEKKKLEAKVKALEAELKAKDAPPNPGDGPSKDDVDVLQARLQKERDAHMRSLAQESPKS